MAATSFEVLTAPHPTGMRSYASPTRSPAKSGSPPGWHHHSEAPTAPREKRSLPMRSMDVGKPMRTSKPAVESPSLEVGDARRRRSVRSRSGKSRDAKAPLPSSQWVPAQQLPSRTRGGQGHGEWSPGVYQQRAPGQSRRQVEPARRTIEYPVVAPQSIRSVGAWSSDASPYRAPRLPSEELDDYRVVVGSKGSQKGPGLPTPPPTPDMGRLGTPELAPLSFDVEFCACCSCREEDRVSDTWYLAGRDKYDVQLDEARAHIARMNSKVDRLLK